MNRNSQNQTLQRQHSGVSNAHRHTDSFTATDIPASASPAFYGNNRDRAGGGQPSFDVARSPPNVANKNTKHVPCKFFRQGACQAGAACPFSHSMDPMMHQAPCKYFMKGNCKFGAKCALAHYLPNGHRVSRADLDPGMRAFGTTRGSEAPPFPAPEQQNFNDSYLPPPFNPPEYFPGTDLPFLDDEQDAYNDRYNQYQSNTNYDSGIGSPPASQFGSPPADSVLHKTGPGNFHSALNAPLPSSFDANSLPHIAKFGPFGHSVPDKFGMRSPPTSAISRNIKLGSPPESSHPNRLSSIGSTLRNVSTPLSMSPQNADDSIGHKTMHSQKQSKPRMISASVPRTSLHEWGNEDIGTEADLLPSSLHDDVMLPQEKVRMLSRPDHNNLSSSAREGSNGLNIPLRSPNQVGSPPTGSSPSRFRAFFDEQRKKDESASTGNPFGHVGSPLRESWMPHETGETPRPIQISGISQQMARMELNRTESSETNGSSRPPLSSLRSSSGIARFDRTVSSPRLQGRRTDEDSGEGGLFEMDDESNKRHSGWSQMSGSTGTVARDRPTDNIRSEAPRAFDIGNAALRPIFGFGQP